MFLVKIEELQAPELVAALFTSAEPAGMSILQYNADEQLDIEDAKAHAARKVIDYLKGRRMKLDLRRLPTVDLFDYSCRGKRVVPALVALAGMRNRPEIEVSIEWLFPEASQAETQLIGLARNTLPDPVDAAKIVRALPIEIHVDERYMRFRNLLTWLGTTFVTRIRL